MKKDKVHIPSKDAKAPYGKKNPHTSQADVGQSGHRLRKRKYLRGRWGLTYTLFLC